MPTYYSFEGDATFYTWEEIHNLGYTNHPTEQIDIKSIAQWGGIEDLGLMDLGGEVMVTPIQAEYWINDGGRWYSLNELAQSGFYPGIANDNVIVNNGSIQCYTAILYGELQHPYYLIEKAPELGWLNETEFSENGWVIGELPDQNKTFYVLDAVTGEELNSTKGVVDHLVCDRYNILEDGGVKHLRVHDGLVGYMADNNPVTITPSSFGAVLYKSNGTNVILRDSSKEYTIRHVLIDEFTVADEYLPQLYISDSIPALLVVKMNSGTYDSVEIYQIEYEETSPTPSSSIEIFLGLSYSSESGSFAARTFSAHDYWGSAILDQSDKDTLEDFGVSILPFSENVTYGPNGSISESNMSSFSFEVLGLYSGMRTGELVADLSNFSAEPKAGTSWNDRVCICSVNAYNQNVMTWKCRITKINA